jgi:hypothetical protein
MIQKKPFFPRQGNNFLSRASASSGQIDQGECYSFYNVFFLTAAPLFYCEPLRHQQAYEQRTLEEVKRKLMQEFVDLTDHRIFAEGKDDELLGRWQYRRSKSKGAMKPRQAWQHASLCHALITGSPV